MPCRSSKKAAISQDAVRTLKQFLNLPPNRRAPQGATTAGMVERRCRYCERTFQPSKYQPAHLVCSDPGCQRRRRAEYHRQKIAADPEYRQVCLDSPQKWRSRTPGYWRRYREQHPAAVERNRQQQHVRDQKRRLSDLANNNSVFDLKLPNTTSPDCRPRDRRPAHPSAPACGPALFTSSKLAQSLLF